MHDSNPIRPVYIVSWHLSQIYFDLYVTSSFFELIFWVFFGFVWFCPVEFPTSLYFVNCIPVGYYLTFLILCENQVLLSASKHLKVSQKEKWRRWNVEEVNFEWSAISSKNDVDKRIVNLDMWYLISGGMLLFTSSKMMFNTNRYFLLV